VKVSCEVIARLPIKTIDGEFWASYSHQGLCSLEFPDKAKGPEIKNQSVNSQVERWHKQTTQAVDAVLAGKPLDTLPPFDLNIGTSFQREVWKAMRQIKPGKTRSYAELAQTIGRPKATRAVGGACGSNPIPLLIPCHRVLAAHQKLGGFSGGLHWKKLLLARESPQLEF